MNVIHELNVIGWGLGRTSLFWCGRFPQEVQRNFPHGMHFERSPDCRVQNRGGQWSE